MRISDWSSDVCSSDLILIEAARLKLTAAVGECGGGIARPPPGFAPAHILDHGGHHAIGPAAFRHGFRAYRAIALCAPRPRQMPVAVHRMGGEIQAESRSAERRGGKEGVRTCRTRLAPYH